MTITLEEAQKGINCPHCGQFAKMYKRKLNSQMARFLVCLLAVEESTGGFWVSSRKINPGAAKASDDGTYLLHWELIEKHPEESATYRLTRKGRNFAQGCTTVSKHVYLYNNELMGMSSEYTDVQTALGDKFDYYELIAAR